MSDIVDHHTIIGQIEWTIEHKSVCERAWRRGETVKRVNGLDWASGCLRDRLIPLVDELLMTWLTGLTREPVRPPSPPSCSPALSSTSVISRHQRPLQLDMTDVVQFRAGTRSQRKKEKNHGPSLSASDFCTRSDVAHAHGVGVHSTK